MSQDVLHDFESLSRDAQPAPANARVRIGHNRPPAGVPRGVLLTFAASFGVLLLALSAPAFGAAPFPLLFAIFAICLGAYFAPFFATHAYREATERQAHADVDTGSGVLSAKAAAWQILPLPIFLASFGIFAIAAKAVIFA